MNACANHHIVGASPKERLILAGIEVLQENGIAGFSARKTTALCGVSPAALYKHFANREELLTAIISYINQRWYDIQAAVIEQCKGETVKDQIVVISMAYIRFLADNPEFRTVLMMNDEQMPPEDVRMKSDLSRLTKELITCYCAETGMAPERRHVKTFIVRSLIYGAALMFDNGQIAYDDENLLQVEQAIRREFELA